MLPGKQYTPVDYAAMAWRRRWIILCSLLIGGYAGLVVSSRLPSMFESEMLIQVVPQRVPDAYVRSTVTMRTVDRLSALYEQITSRTELERLVREMNLYPELQATLPMQDVVEQVRLNIKVDPNRAGANQDADSFYVRYSYPDANIARQVTERLGRLFKDVNASDRGNLAEDTNSFLQTQLDEAKKLLEAQEDRLKRFRELNAGRLPTQLQFNMQAMQNGQLRAQAIVEALARDRDRKQMLERLYADAQAEMLAAPPPPPPQAVTAAQTTQGQPAAAAGTTAQQLAAARQVLVAYELRLKPEHPDVTRTKSLIAKLEAQLAEETRLAEQALRAGAEAEAPPVLSGATPQEVTRRERLQQMRAEIESLQRQIEFREAEEQTVRGSIADVERRIEQVPGVESEWIALSRDYDTQQTAYRELLAKAGAAKLAANLEQRQIGEQFRILDPARTPIRPTGVNRLEVNGMAAAIGLMMGLAIAALLELRDRSFRHSADVVEVLKLPVIALVPEVASPEGQRRTRARQLVVLTVGAFVTVLGGYGFWTMQLWKFVV